MTAATINRLLSAMVVMLGVTSLTFALLHFIPGDPIEVMLGEAASTADRERLRIDLGLNEPLGKQWLAFHADLLRLDFGQSLYSKRPILDLLLTRAPWTLALAVASLAVAIVIAFPLGILAALKPSTVWDTLSSSLSLLGVSVPNFLLGPLLIIVFSLTLGWLPISGNESAGSIVLPAVTLGTSLAAILARMVRASLLEVFSEPYILAVRARGVSMTRLVIAHAIPNAGLPILTVLGLQLGALLGGAVITEIIFSWPGLGQLLIEGIQRRDYPVVQACVLVISGVYVLVNTATDIAYAYIDPRISLR